MARTAETPVIGETIHATDLPLWAPAAPATAVAPRKSPGSIRTSGVTVKSSLEALREPRALFLDSPLYGTRLIKPDLLLSS